MIVHQRKSKYKHKISMPRTESGWQHPKVDKDMQVWCEQTFGPGGRKQRWRFGWTHEDATFYFKEGKDAIMFTLRWTS